MSDSELYLPDEPFETDNKSINIIKENIFFTNFEDNLKRAEQLKNNVQDSHLLEEINTKLEFGKMIYGLISNYHGLKFLDYKFGNIEVDKMNDFQKLLRNIIEEKDEAIYTINSSLVDVYKVRCQLENEFV